MATKSSRLPIEVLPTAHIMSPFFNLAFAALLLILPGFATDLVGLLIIFPPTRKLVFGKVSKKYSESNREKQDFINGEFEDIDDDNDKKI